MEKSIRQDRSKTTQNLRGEKEDNMDKDITVQNLAQEALQYFTTGKRPDGTVYVHARLEGHPEWVYEMIRAAHGDFLPDDYRYSMIFEALEAISESDGGWEDLAHEVADGAVSVYTGDQHAWFGSHAARGGYCDQASDEGLVADDAGIDARIAAGWYLEAQEVFQSVLESLQEQEGEAG